MHYAPILPKVLAYLDPGSGSMIIQLALAALLGAGVFIKLQWARIKKLFNRNQPSKEENESEE
jgi:hypothetical protein